MKTTKKPDPLADLMTIHAKAEELRALVGRAVATDYRKFLPRYTADLLRNDLDEAAADLGNLCELIDGCVPPT